MEKKVKKNISISPTLWNESEKASSRLGISISSLIAIAIVEKLNRMQKE